MTTSQYLAAAVQFEPTMGDTEGNVSRLLELTADAATRGADLVVLPEMATTGYCWSSREEIAPFVETIPGPTIERFCALAAERQVWIVVGMPEVDGETGAYYNSAALVGPEGVRGTYRKTHAFITEVRWATDGDLGLPVFETPLGRLGILICMDAEYPETARVLALQGCDVVCFPTNWLGEHSPSPFWMQRAYENGAFWVAANRYGLERGVQFSGGSAVIGPDGRIRDLVDSGDGIAMAAVDLSLARQERADRLRRRRPDHYRDVSLNSYLWPSVHTRAPNDGGALDALGAPSEPTAVTLVAVPPWLSDVSILERTSEDLLKLHPALAVLPPLAAPSIEAELTDAAAKSGRMLDQLQDLARHHDTLIVTSAPLLEEGCVFDAVVLLRPDGGRVVHRNTHPRGGRSWARPGGSVPPVERTPVGLVGLLAADELLPPEPLRGVAARGAEFVAVSGGLEGPAVVGVPATSIPLPDRSPRAADPEHWILPRVRAAESNVWLALAATGDCPSGIYGPSFYRFPRHEALARSAAAVLELRADPSDRDRRTALEKPYLRMRLPHLYGPLTWNRVTDGDGSLPQ